MWDIEPDSYGDVSRSPEAIPRIIEGLEQKGYRFVTVTELLELVREIDQ